MSEVSPQKIDLDLVSQFDACAATWEAEHGPASARAREYSFRIRYLRALCRSLGHPSVLDLGCATGRTLLDLADVIAAGTGVDCAAAMIERARQNATDSRLQFQVGDAADFCARSSEQFELVLLVGVLPHLPAPGSALDGVRRVLKEQGHLVIICPHPWSPAFCLKRLIDGHLDGPSARHLSPRELRALAARHGLELAAVAAMPYAPWPRLANVLGCRGAPMISERHHPLTGAIRGAFAARFRHCV